jgi:very-short-patch-repair endonuclease
MGKKSIRRTQDEFEKDVLNAVGEEYTVIGEYINTDTKVMLRHNKCNNTFEVRPYLFLGKISTRCPYCNGNKKRTTEDFIGIVERLTGKEYSVIGSYKNTDTPILLKHNICGSDFLMRPACFIKGQRCPRCERSIGSDTIKKYLIENNIQFLTERKYTDLMDERELRFDFYIPEFDALIEFDGEQHFREKSFGANKEKSKREFEKLKMHDMMKNEYCKAKNIPLLRIPFWEINNIDNILKRFIELLKVTESDNQLLNEFISDVFSKKLNISDKN